MSSQQDQARVLAERIARRISHTRAEKDSIGINDAAGHVGEALAAMRASLDELQQRLTHIESHLTQGTEGRSGSQERSTNRSEQESSGRQPKPQQQSSSSAPPSIRSPWLSGMYVPAAHPSQERFGVEEAAVSELVDYFEREKTCNMEPGGKPCDHCEMCSSRGF